MYKRDMGMLPNIFNDMFMKQTPAHNYNMRQHKQFASLLLIVYHDLYVYFMWLYSILFRTISQ